MWLSESGLVFFPAPDTPAWPCASPMGAPDTETAAVLRGILTRIQLHRIKCVFVFWTFFWISLIFWGEQKTSGKNGHPVATNRRKNYKMKKQKWSFRTLQEPQRSQKKIWTTGVEIYRSVTSNYEKGTPYLSFWDHVDVATLLNADSPIFEVLVSRRALKVEKSSSQIVFCSKFHRK